MFDTTYTIGFQHNLTDHASIILHPLADIEITLRVDLVRCPAGRGGDPGPPTIRPVNIPAHDRINHLSKGSRWIELDLLPIWVC